MTNELEAAYQRLHVAAHEVMTRGATPGGHFTRLKAALDQVDQALAAPREQAGDDSLPADYRRAYGSGQ